MQKFDVYSALLAETDITLKKNQRTTFVVFHRSVMVNSFAGVRRHLPYPYLQRCPIKGIGEHETGLAAVLLPRDQTGIRFWIEFILRREK